MFEILWYQELKNISNSQGGPFYLCLKFFGIRNRKLFKGGPFLCLKFFGGGGGRPPSNYAPGITGNKFGEKNFSIMQTSTCLFKKHQR